MQTDCKSELDSSEEVDIYNILILRVLLSLDFFNNELP